MKKLFFFAFVIAMAHFAPEAISQGVWTQKADFGGVPREWAVGFSIGNKGYIGTGRDWWQVDQKDFWEWDQTTNVWTQKADFGGTARLVAVGFSIGTNGYIGTGIGYSTGIQNDFWEWDQTTNVWTKKADFAGTARKDAVGFSIGTMGYIGTGDLNSNPPYMNDFWEWDQLSDTWNQKISFAGAGRYDAVGFSIGAKGYIGTGIDGVNQYDDFWEYDPTANTWTQKANFLGGATSNNVSFSMNGKGYIRTGLGFWEYDPNSNSWASKANFIPMGNTGRFGSVGFSIGNKGYIGTGSDNVGNMFPDFWEYCDTCSGASTYEIDLENLISVYPNPTSGKAEVKSKKLEVRSIEAYNTTGEKVYSLNTSTTQSLINLSDQPDGVYFLQIKTKQGNVTKKIIVSR